MNIKNIADLAKQLESLGFEQISYYILKRICFKPGSFFLSYRIEKGNDRLKFLVHFEKDVHLDEYFLVSYDAILHKGMVIPHQIINGVSPGDLAEQMDTIDWKTAFEINEIKPWSVDDKKSWEKEEKIETIIENLSAISKTQEGNAFAVSLKLKFWVTFHFPAL